MKNIPSIKEEPIVILEEIKIKSIVELNSYKKWAQENIKNHPPINVTQDQKLKSRLKIENRNKLNIKN